MLDLFGEPGINADGSGGMHGGDLGQYNEASALLKAISGDGGTDHALLTGGAALRRESLEASLISITSKEKNYKAWNTISQSRATAFVDEWSRITDNGGFYEGGAAQAELDAILESTGEYAREFDKVKLLASRRTVGVGAEIQSQNGLISAIAQETQNGTRELLRNMNWLAYFGDKSVSAVEYDGLATILEREGFVIDMEGKTIPADASPIREAAADVAGVGKFGELDTYYCSHLVQVDLNNNLNPSFRIGLDSQPKTSIALGATVELVETGFGQIRRQNDPFIQESLPPWIARSDASPARAAAAAIVPPTSASGAPTADAASKFAAGHAGNYYYAVEAANARGRSATLVKTAAVTVAAGEKVTLTIVPDGASDSTNYVIHRSRLNGTNGDADFREIARVPKAASGDTTFVDLNESIPGTSKMFLTQNTEDVVAFRRLNPLSKFNLFPTNQLITTWAMFCFLYLRVATPEKCFMIKNILPSGAKWRPFNV